MTIGLQNWLGQQVVDNTLSPVRSALDQWLAEHGWILFLVNHPLVLLGLLLLGLFLISGVWRALSRLSENLWIFIVGLPFQVLGWFGLRGISLLKQRTQPRVSGAPSQENRLTELLNRLDALREEQETVLKEVRSLLEQSPQR
ncbi:MULTISPECIES: hypothetical protein [unclassified Leptolyngbya]|uniref:hypothetical protein n=1 Tax=unclassified Leptolyngbya TaxID=2650499 RepID=UPI001683FCAD|nr:MULTISPECIES: hypothetical protein [unclassified Leptolyngbya]MBD1910190.1 hypothetical protein [Leptolyngbya sp. FACHB-8]MBD2153823.1 hypothetical protein [Leptolyngbya sp. FACHB-16]